MSLAILPEACIGCGACEPVCPTGAVQRPSADQPNVFWIETYLCNDCGACQAACPVACIVADPDSIVCRGRGCPVAPERRGPYAGWECTRQEARCTACGDVLWRHPGTDTWRCVSCDPLIRSACPKTVFLRRGRTGQRPLRRRSA